MCPSVREPFTIATDLDYTQNQTEAFMMAYGREVNKIHPYRYIKTCALEQNLVQKAISYAQTKPITPLFKIVDQVEEQCPAEWPHLMTLDEATCPTRYTKSTERKEVAGKISGVKSKLFDRSSEISPNSPMRGY